MMMIYKIFRGKGEKKDLIGILPERRPPKRITEESIDKYARSILGSYINGSEVILESEMMKEGPKIT